MSRVQSIHLDLTCYTGGIKAALAVVDILDELSSQWAQARQEDPSYDEIVEAVRKGERKFPVTLGVKVSISEYKVRDNKLLF